MEEFKEADKYIKYLEGKVAELEGRILKMIHANRQRQISLTLEEVNEIIEAGGDDGC